MAKQKFNYTGAFDELHTIITELENEHVTIDLLPHKIEKAAELILFCENYLKQTEEEINATLKKLK